MLLEASDGVGGRVRTDIVDGFTLDRGFAIFLTSYPETQVSDMGRLGSEIALNNDSPLNQ